MLNVGQILLDGGGLHSAIREGEAGVQCVELRCLDESPLQLRRRTTRCWHRRARALSSSAPSICAASASRHETCHRIRGWRECTGQGVKSITLGGQLFRCAEGYFQPTLWGKVPCM